MHPEDQFKLYCADLNRFLIHFTLEDDFIDDSDESGKFKQCKKCNRPTIDHERPLHSKCKLEIVNDADDLFDIEQNIRAKQEFKDAFRRLWEKEVKDEEIRELTTCYLCQKFCITEIDLKKHKIKQ